MQSTGSGSFSDNYERLILLTKAVYVAGPMRFLPLFNFPAFDAERDRLKALGYRVISPADLDRAAGDTNPETEEAMPFSTYMRRDIEALLKVDAISFLPGWENSQGANIEKIVGEALGLKMYFPGDEVPSCR